ncbi:MAG: hypothetical protein H8E32_11595 [Nitrospinae bacterium]|nr:hypothetical protein [Nitrospinota bacterium]
MIWIDFALLWYACFRACRSGCEWTFRCEKLALAFLFALALKSLVLFLLIRLGIQPTAGIQVGISVLVLLSSLLLVEKPNIEEPPTQETGLFWITLSGVGGLFVFSMINAWFFPITESDAIWYHIRGMSFFHEVRFDSEWVVPQLRQYPPFIPLVFTYLISFKVEFLKIVFPLLYLCLNIIFYSRVLSLTENKKMACLFTIVLATTPYFWWHGVLPFLDMTTAVFYSTGTLYWYCWIKKKVEGPTDESAENSYAVISSALLGLAAWTRIEFLLYDLVPVFLTLYVFSRYSEKSGNQKILQRFFLCLLFFPSIWFLNLLTFDMVLWSQMKMVGGVCAFLWVLAIGLALCRRKLSESFVQLAFVLSAAGYFLVLFLFATGAVPVWQKLVISLYRTSTVHIFYLFTSSLVIFLFFEKLKELPEQKKMLGYFLILFLCTHLAIFSYSTPKWPTLGEFVYATFIQPGNSVNLSDTRGMMSIYPVFIFFIASLPFVRRRLINE